MRHDILSEPAILDILRRIRILENTAPVGFTAVTRGALRIASNEGLLVQGSAKVEGWLIVTGTGRVTGLLEVLGQLQGSGELIWTGPASFSGDTSIGGTLEVGASVHFVGNTVIDGSLEVGASAHFTGDTDIDGTLIVGATTTLDGDITVNGDLTLSGGRIMGGGLTIQSGQIAFAGGGIIQASGGNFLIAPSSLVFIDGAAYVDGFFTVGSSQSILGGLSVSDDVVMLQDLNVQGDLIVDGAKSFGMEHPGKPGTRIRHASTESPVSGIEYWGSAELDENGAATVVLPDYFEAIAKPVGRTAFVTGRGFIAEWSDIVDAAFTVTGTPGKAFSWLVKAERIGGEFPVESPMPPPRDIPERV